jgi:germination protein M
VRITVRGQELAYRDKQSFRARDVLLTSTEDIVGTAAATLYFLDGDGVLTGETRTLALYEGDTQVEAVIKALEQGPESRELSGVLPDTMRVKSVRLEEGCCYVNLPSAVLTELPEGELETAFQALEQSLCSLNTVDEVRFLVDGELTEPYRGASPSEKN